MNDAALLEPYGNEMRREYTEQLIAQPRIKRDLVEQLNRINSVPVEIGSKRSIMVKVEQANLSLMSELCALDQ